MASCCDNSLDTSYINKNDINEVKGPAQVANGDAQNAKQLVVVDFNENVMNSLGNYFYNVDNRK